MKTIERYLCAECVKAMEQAGLIFKKIPHTEGDKAKCDWCLKLRYGASYKIKYGRENA